MLQASAKGASRLSGLKFVQELVQGKYGLIQMRYFIVMTYIKFITQKIMVKRSLQSEFKLFDELELGEQHWNPPAYRQEFSIFNDLFRTGDQPAPLPTIEENVTTLLEDPELFLTPLTITLKIEETPSEINLCKTEQTQDETLEFKPTQCWEGSQKFSSYNVGHLNYVSTLRTPIFGLSRCFERTKRRKGNNETYFTFIAKSMQARKNNRPDTQYAKRYDQGLQDKLADHDRLKTDITVTALRDAAKKIHKPQQAAVITKLSTKYKAKRHWANFLQKFVNQVPQQENWNIPNHLA